MFNLRSRPQPLKQEQHCSPKALLVAVVVLLTIGSILTCVGLFTPYLVTAELSVLLVTIGTGHVGIYTECVVSGDTIGCGSLLHSDVPEWLKGCQAFGFLGSLSALVGWIMLLCWMCQKAKTKFLKYAIHLILLLTVLFFAVALVFFAVRYDRLWLSYDLAWGFYVSWVGAALMVAANIVFWFYPTGPGYSQMPSRQPIQPTLQPQPRPAYQPQHVYQSQPAYQPQPQPHVYQPQSGFQPQPQPMQPMRLAPTTLQNQLGGMFVNRAAYGYNGYNNGYTAYR